MVDTLSFAREEGLSIEEAARHLRYQKLKGMAYKCGCKYIATAHTFDDQVETLLLRIFKGTGIRGLVGIQRVRRDGVIRPLLKCRKEELLKYVKKEDIPFVIDPSNEDTSIERNRIRNLLLPEIIKTFGDGALRGIYRTCSNLEPVSDYIESILKEHLENVDLKEDASTITIPLSVLSDIDSRLLPEFIAYVFDEFFHGYKRPTKLHIESIVRIVEKRDRTKVICLPGDLVACIEKDRLVIKRRNRDRSIPR